MVPIDRGYLKHVFPGGNTPRGFFSFYDQIIGAEAKRILIIKGGPGVGKSSFMRSIGETMLCRGYDVEFHHCSSDNHSLDGILIPEIGVAMLDGTAPHIVDPKHPGCVDEIVNFGDYWNENGIVAGKRRILELSQTVGRYFQRAYRYLAAARSVYDEWENCNQYAFDPGIANLKAETLRKMILGERPISGRPGRVRHLFASAITPNGPINFLESIFMKAEKVWCISGEPGTGKATIMENLTQYAAERGLLTECYHCPFDPDKIEHIWWSELRLGITTKAWPHLYQGEPNETIELDMNETLNCAIRERFQSAIETAHLNYLKLFNLAVEAIQQAKQVHDEMEKYYISHMDFAGIDALKERTLNRILEYAGEKETMTG
jgi:hypothetical protein